MSLIRSGIELLNFSNPCTGLEVARVLQALHLHVLGPGHFTFPFLRSFLQKSSLVISRYNVIRKLLSVFVQTEKCYFYQ